MARVIDEGLSKRELEDVIDNDDFSKYGNALTNFSSQLSTSQSLLAMNVLKDPYRLDFVTLERGYDEHDLESAIAKTLHDSCLNLEVGLLMSEDSLNLSLATRAISQTCCFTIFGFVAMWLLN